MSLDMPERSERLALDLNSEQEFRGQPSLRRHVVDVFRRDLTAKAGLVIVGIVVLLTIFGPLIAPHSLTASTANIDEAPGFGHWFGTDDSGLDVFSRVIAAPRVDLSIAIFGTFGSVVVGSAIGLFATFFGGRLGALAIRVTDTIQAFPALILAIIVVVLTGNSISNIIVVIAVLNTPLYARLMRAQVLSLRERSFVEAARASGMSDFAIAWRQVLPNAAAPVSAQISITIGWAILATAGLSFLGAGVRPPSPEWGSMISSGSSQIITGQWWPSVFPGIAMAITVFGFAAVGEALQTALRREG